LVGEASVGADTLITHVVSHYQDNIWLKISLFVVAACAKEQDKNQDKITLRNDSLRSSHGSVF